METLELKHLAPYLPYGLKMIYVHTNKIGQISNIYTLGSGYNNDDIKISIDYSEGEHIWMYKPILRPLSDLTKEIEIDGEKIVISNEYGYYRFDEMSTLKGGSVILSSIMLKEYEIILKYHFDIFGLIEKGFAIDINTLNK